mmetsp:Transcript_123575/g.174184  ORF Transcript_123575/g.174184 Transcript_123575/m.174184 type:complete len:146 (-) Transcript_123575:109-546(-)
MGFAYMLIVRYFSGLIVWGSILLYLVLIIVLAYYCNNRADDYKEVEDTDNENSMRYTAYVLWAIAGISIILIFCFRNKIRLAIAIIKTATLYVKDVPTSFLVPPLFTIALICWWVFWIFSFVYVYATADGFTGSETSPFATVNHN